MKDHKRKGQRRGRDSDRRDSRGPKRFGGRDSGRKPPGYDRKELKAMRTTVTCDSCKKKCEVPFKPTGDKPVYCSDCFRKDKPTNGLEEINQKLDKIMRALKI